MGEGPAERQAAALAAIDRQIGIARKTAAWLEAAGLYDTEALADDLYNHLVEFLPPVILPMLEGRRRILVRHAPVPVDGPSGRRYACAAHGYAWQECPDWADAAAGLPLDAQPRPEDPRPVSEPRRRLRGCVERWPGALLEGDYHPSCCRFPKSCSADVYDDEHVTDDDLEREPS